MEQPVQADFGLEFADRRQRELDALPRILGRFVDEGYALVTVGELLSTQQASAPDLMKVGG